ncbi:cytokinesis protein 3 [Blyttiomyces sp. JEL0837]|nr:cytokinesis protein 3 [Blyttiomyces sp. JEL0837]
MVGLNVRSLSVIYETTTYAIEVHSTTLDELKRQLCREFAFNRDEFDSMDIVHDSMVIAGLKYYQSILRWCCGKERLAEFTLRPKISTSRPAMVSFTSLDSTAKSSTDSIAPASYDVMLSYEWKSGKEIILKINEKLKSLGIRVWLDENEMRANMYERMAEAITRSLRSANCKRELSYAADLRKHIEPTRALQQHEKLESWAELITAGMIYYDFSNTLKDTDKLNKSFDALYTAIRHGMEMKVEPPPIMNPVDPLFKWLRPVDFTNDLARFEKDYVEGTGTWAVHDVHRWLQDGLKSVLWLNGGAGLGKSVINNAERIISTIAFNLASKLPAFRDFLLKEMEHDNNRVEKGETSILFKPSIAFNELLPHFLLIVDALDEVGLQGDLVRNEFLNLIRYQIDKLPSWIRVFTTSRPEMDIYQTLNGVNFSVLLNNMQDIQTFVQHQLSTQLIIDEVGDDDGLKQLVDKVTEKQVAMVLLQLLSNDNGTELRLVAKWVANIIENECLTETERNGIYTRTTNLLEDAARLIWRFYAEMTYNPLQIYSVAVPFSPRDTSIYKTFHSEMMTLSQLLKSRIGYTSVILWDVSSAQVVKALKLNRAEVFGASFSPDVSLLALNMDRSIQIIDVVRGCSLMRLRGMEPLAAVACSPSGEFIAAGGCDGRIEIWDSRNGNKLTSLNPDFVQNKHNRVVKIQYSQDGRFLVSGEKYGWIRVWNVETGDEKFWFNANITVSSVVSMSISKFGDKLVSSTKHAMAFRIWDIESHQKIGTVLSDGEILSCALSPDSGIAMTSCKTDGQISVWDLSQFAQNSPTFHPSGGSMFVKFSPEQSRSGFTVKVSPDGTRAATFNSFREDTVVTIWDIASGKALNSSEVKRDVSRGAVMGRRWRKGDYRDGLLAVSASQDEIVIVWDVTNGVPSRTLSHSDLVGGGHRIESISFLNDGCLAASIKGDKFVIWDLESAVVKKSVQKTGDQLCLKWQSCLSSNGKIAAFGCYDDRIVTLDVASGDTERTISHSQSKVSAIKFNSDNQKLLSIFLFSKNANRKSVLLEWDVSTGNVLRSGGGTQFEYLCKIGVLSEAFYVSGTENICSVFCLSNGFALHIL